MIYDICALLFSIFLIAFSLFNLSLQSVSIENVEFNQTWNGCPRLTWNTTNYGLCDVTLFLSFVQADNSTQNVTVNYANGNYENCNLSFMNITSVRYKTIVTYGNEILDNNGNSFSEDIPLQIMKGRKDNGMYHTYKEILKI